MSMFSNAHSFTLSASEISSVAGDQNVNYHNYEPFSVHIESALDGRTIGDLWHYQPQPLPSLSDPSLPANHRYSLLLLSAKEGYPLWRPEPNRRLPEQYRRSGLPIGSVGIIRPDGFFDYLFNICFPSDHPVNVGGVPEGFKPVEFSQTDVSEVDPFHDPDAHVASPTGYIAKTLVSSGNTYVGQSRTYDFMSTHGEGAILMLPDGSTRIDLENKKIFRQYANRNAHRWFTYVEEARGRESEDLSLYIITGTDRSSSFGVASFCNPQNQKFSLKFNIDQRTHMHSWSKHHYVESRSGPRLALGDSTGIDRPTNQSIFLRGFKIHKRKNPKGKEVAHRVESIVTNDSGKRTANSSKHPVASTSKSGSFSQGWSTWGTTTSGRAFVSDSQKMEQEKVKVEHVPSHTAVYHPCDTINNFMLELLSATPGRVGSGPSFAISHDDDWRSVWDESNSKLPMEQELIRRICSKSQFVIDNGTIYPDPLDDVSPRKSPLSPDESITTRILVIFTCPVLKCGEQFQQQSLLITHMQQKHDVVHGTAARVPLSAAAASSASTAPKPPSQPDKKKRRGGVAALSCAECRRLKLKCSRVFPCTGCVKKGCAAICPDGHLTTGKGNRFVLANTNELQDKIEELTKRAKALEDALTKSHNLVSPQPHPLLSDDLLQITRTVKEESPEPNLSRDSTAGSEEEDSKQGEDEALIVYKSSLGSLYTGEPSTFYGRSATSWHFLLNELGANQHKESTAGAIKRPLPNNLSWLAYSFPFSAPAHGSTRQKLVEFLPKVAVARRHCQNYYRYGAWQYTPISEVDFKTFIFQPFYEPDDTTVCEDPLVSHNLAILFLVIALGALLDLEGPSHTPEAKWYYQLGKAALALEPVLDSSSLSTIQALILLSHYMLLDDIHDPRWPIMGLASKLTQTAGLHIDGTHWNLPPEETFRRRCLFWEVYSYDILQGLTYGRPPHMSLSFVDTKKPFETTRDANGDVEMTCDAWKHKFFGECLGIIWNKAFGAHPLSYDMLKHLDQQMRAYYVPPSLRVPGFGGAKLNQDVHPPSPELTMQRHFLVALKEITSFYMHRSFFVTAVREKPDNPIEHHPYGESVQTIYESACICVGLMRNLFRHQPLIMQRFSFFFDHILSCAHVLGMIASKPKVSMALSALTNLELVYDFFEAMNDNNPRRTKFLTVTSQLRDQARLALNVTQNPLTEAQKLARPKPIKTEEPVQDRQQSSWTNRVPVSLPSSSSPTSPSAHQYSPTNLISPSFQPTYNAPQPTQYPLYSSLAPTLPQPEQPSLSQPFGDSFFDQPNTAYNPITGYQYHDYQEAGYFQQEMDYQPGFDASGDVVMPMLEESWQNFMTQFRQ
ncbi:hypothetical protein F5890DRAFT_1504313 [Lentinula detonsa]|uniref:Zn(2)-C6 fungal-type domain-containing protein n=1 Tax=Lentinula detonsa TaxID=2804962 RepID=A0AA38UTV9_9AGAR|nr:hypothetical protein F5890DRAFT_1504313 [Lentinula detonsa]